MTCQCPQCRHYRNPEILKRELLAEMRGFQRPRLLKPMPADLARQYAD